MGGGLALIFAASVYLIRKRKKVISVEDNSTMSPYEQRGTAETSSRGDDKELALSKHSAVGAPQTQRSDDVGGWSVEKMANNVDASELNGQSVNRIPPIPEAAELGGQSLFEPSARTGGVSELEGPVSPPYTITELDGVSAAQRGYHGLG